MRLQIIPPQFSFHEITDWLMRNKYQQLFVRYIFSLIPLDYQKQTDPWNPEKNCFLLKLSAEFIIIYQHIYDYSCIKKCNIERIDESFTRIWFEITVYIFRKPSFCLEDLLERLTKIKLISRGHVESSQNPEKVWPIF